MDGLSPYSFSFRFLRLRHKRRASDSGREKPAATSKTDADAPILKVTHDEDVDGWRVAETIHFRLYHQHLRTLAEAVLRAAERTRASQQRKWFGGDAADWDSKCRICLYPNGPAYSQATGAPTTLAGGHTDITLDEGRVLGRTIHLHGDRDALLRGVLPHEVTHAVLAGHFGGERVPRWADEGMAILAETPSRSTCTSAICRAGGTINCCLACAT